MGNLRTVQKYTPDGNHRLITVVTFSHVKGLLKFSAYFHVLAATNPCPCGWRNDAQKPVGVRPLSLPNMWEQAFFTAVRVVGDELFRK
jgi:hypothetical protein